jgi:hypothetical protein
VLLSRAMTNPLTRQVKGFPVYGWLVLIITIIIALWAGYEGTLRQQCTPEGDFVEQF